MQIDDFIPAEFVRSSHPFLLLIVRSLLCENVYGGSRCGHPFGSINCPGDPHGTYNSHNSHGASIGQDVNWVARIFHRVTGAACIDLIAARRNVCKAKTTLRFFAGSAIGFNLALLIRKSAGIGKPRTLQGSSTTISLAQTAWKSIFAAWNKFTALGEPHFVFSAALSDSLAGATFRNLETSTTGC